MSIQKVFDQAKSGMNASQSGLKTTSHNISNVNTEGYSRQRVEQQAIADPSLSGNRIGMGTRVKAITRANSSFLARRIEAENADLGKARAGADIFSQIETMFAADSEKGITSSMTNFFNSARELSTEPNSMPLRASFVESAKSMAFTFNETFSALDDIRVDVDNRVSASVDHINGITREIARMNERIQAIEGGGGGVANDERDQRDLLVRSLSKVIDVQVTELDGGGINVSTGQVGPIVAGVENFELASMRQDDPDFSSIAKVFLKSPSGRIEREVTGLIKGGELGAYLEARDTHLRSVLSDVNTLSRSLAQDANFVQSAGFDRSGRPGVELFKGFDGTNFAESMQVNQEIIADPSRLAGAAKSGAPGDNRAFLDLTRLETNKAINGESSYNEFASNMIGRVGVEAQGFNKKLEMQEDLLLQLDNLHQQEVGVSLDEEALNMVKYQKAFDASAKLIQVADSMMDTVLNLKRF